MVVHVRPLYALFVAAQSPSVLQAVLTVGVHHLVSFAGQGTMVNWLSHSVKSVLRFCCSNRSYSLEMLPYLED